MGRKTIAQIRAELDELNAKMAKRQHISDKKDAANHNKSIKMTGSKRGAMTSETKLKIGEKNSRSTMSDYQRQQLIKSNKENPRHTIPHSEKTKEKIKKILAAKPDYICPHCGLHSRSGVIKRWHFDNCKYKK